MNSFGSEISIPQNPSNTNGITRRQFLQRLALLFGGKTAMDFLAACSPSPSSSGKPEKGTPETLKQTPLEFGFTTHVHVDPKPGQNLTLETFKKSVDRLSAAKQGWIRFNIWEWEVAKTGNPTSIEWNEENLKKYDEAVDYAQKKGLKIFGVMSLPNFAEKYNLNEYENFAGIYAEYLARRYKGKVGVWQMFNEADRHRYRTYNLFDSPEDSYLNELNVITEQMNNAIKRADPTAKTTMNITPWDLGPNLLSQGTRFFNAVGSSIDYMTLDLYPGNDISLINALPVYVAYFSKYFNKEIIVGELGMPTGDGRFTEADQAKYVPMMVDSLAKGLVKPRAILLYELTDETSAGSRTEIRTGL